MKTKILSGLWAVCLLVSIACEKTETKPNAKTAQTLTITTNSSLPMNSTAKAEATSSVGDAGGTIYYSIAPTAGVGAGSATINTGKQSGSIITPTKIGTVVLTASTDGNAQFEASSVSITITVGSNPNNPPNNPPSNPLQRITYTAPATNPKVNEGLNLGTLISPNDATMSIVAGGTATDVTLVGTMLRATGAGTVRVKFEKTGYTPLERDITIDAAAPRTITYIARTTNPKVNEELNLSTLINPNDATVSIVAGSTTAAGATLVGTTLRATGAGTVRVKFEKTGYTPLEQNITIDAAAIFTLTSEDISEEQFIDFKHACFAQPNGLNESPQLTWEHEPEGTQSYAIIMKDNNAPNFSHWHVLNIPKNKKSMTTDEGWSTDYYGPCPPPGPAHTYVITVYALNDATTLTDPVPASPADIEIMLQRKILARATITVKYTAER